MVSVESCRAVLEAGLELVPEPGAACLRRALAELLRPSEETADEARRRYERERKAAQRQALKPPHVPPLSGTCPEMSPNVPDMSRDVPAALISSLPGSGSPSEA